MRRDHPGLQNKRLKNREQPQRHREEGQRQRHIYKPRGIEEARGPQKQGERHGTDFPLEPAEGTNPDDTFILDLWPPEL